MLNQYVEIFCSYKENVEIPEWRFNISKLPDRAYAFRYFSRREMYDVDEMLKGIKRNISPITYIGKAYTVDEFEKHFDNNENALGYAQCIKEHGYNRILVTKNGEWYYIKDTDIVID